MGYDFKPRNKKSGWYHIGAFSWPLMLNSGLGLVLGTGEGFSPAEFIYVTRPDNKCVQYNDGAKVTAAEAKDLAKVARWISRIQNARIKQWESVALEENQRMESDSKLFSGRGMSVTYKLPWHPDTVKKFTDFADWVEKSGGFSIH